MTRESPGGGRRRASVRLVMAVMGWMAAYVALIVLISWVFDIATWPRPARITAAVLPALPIGGAIIALLKYLTEEADEFQRMLMTRAVLLAMGVTFFVITAWGFLEIYAGAPHFPTSLVMAVFWVAFGVTNGLVRWRAS